MRIKMTEHFQGTGVSAVLVRTGSTVNILEPGEVYEVSAMLGAELLKNRKGVEPEAKHYGGQSEPEYPRNDEAKYDEVSGNFGKLPELTEENMLEEKTAKPKRSRK